MNKSVDNLIAKSYQQVLLELTTASKKEYFHDTQSGFTFIHIPPTHNLVSSSNGATKLTAEYAQMIPKKYNEKFVWYHINPTDADKAVLIENGFVLSDRVMLGMSRDLSVSLPKRPETPDIKIMKLNVKDSERLREWGLLIGVTFSPQYKEHNANVNMTWAKTYVNNEHFIGVNQKGEIVTAGSVGYGVKGAASIYAVATLESERRKGYGSAIVWHILNHVKEKGYKYAVLQADPPGVGVYKKLGFEVRFAFSKFDYYAKN